MLSSPTMARQCVMLFAASNIRQVVPSPTVVFQLSYPIRSGHLAFFGFTLGGIYPHHRNDAGGWIGGGGGSLFCYVMPSALPNVMPW
jgi:hypothetical protein